MSKEKSTKAYGLYNFLIKFGESIFLTDNLKFYLVKSIT